MLADNYCVQRRTCSCMPILGQISTSEVTPSRSPSPPAMEEISGERTHDASLWMGSGPLSEVGHWWVTFGSLPIRCAKEGPKFLQGSTSQPEARTSKSWSNADVEESSIASTNPHLLRRRCPGTSAGEASLRRDSPGRGQMHMFRSRLLPLQTLISSQKEMSGN